MAYERLAITVAAEKAFFPPFPVHIIIVINFRARINNGDQMEALFMQPVGHTCWIRKSARIKHKVFVAIHPVDIEPDSVTRVLTLAQAASHLLHLLLRLIAPA